MGYYRAGGPADWDLSGAQGAAAGRGLATWLYGAEWRDEGPFMPPSYVGRKKKETEMGYYRAGGTQYVTTDVAPYAAGTLAAVPSGGQEWGPGATITTPGRARQLARGEGYSSGRRMNALNPRALRRAMRRVQSFAKFAKRTIQFTHHVKMKKHRRK